MSWIGLKRRNDEGYGHITTRHAGRAIRTKARADGKGEEEDDERFANFAKPKPGSDQVVFPMNNNDVPYITDIINETDEKRRARLVLDYGCGASRNSFFFKEDSEHRVDHYDVSRIAALWRCAMGFPVGTGDEVAEKFAKMAAALVVREGGKYWTRWVEAGGDQHADVGVEFMDAVRAQAVAFRGEQPPSSCPPSMARACDASDTLRELCGKIPTCDDALRRSVLTFRDADVARCCFRNNIMYQLKPAETPGGPMRLVTSTVTPGGRTPAGRIIAAPGASKTMDVPGAEPAASENEGVPFGHKIADQARFETTDVPIGQGLHFAEAWSGPGPTQQVAVFGNTLYFVAQELEPVKRSVVCAHDLDGGPGRRMVVAEKYRIGEPQSHLPASPDETYYAEQGLFLPHVHKTDYAEDDEVHEVWVCFTILCGKLDDSPPWYELKFIAFSSTHKAQELAPSFQEKFESGLIDDPVNCFGVRSTWNARAGCMITINVSGPINREDNGADPYDYFVEQQCVNPNKAVEEPFGFFTEVEFGKIIGKETPIRTTLKSKRYRYQAFTYYAWDVKKTDWCMYETKPFSNAREKTIVPSTNQWGKNLFLRSENGHVSVVEHRQRADFSTETYIANLIQGDGTGLAFLSLPDVTAVHFETVNNPLRPVAWMVGADTIYFQVLDLDAFEDAGFYSDDGY